MDASIAVLVDAKREYTKQLIQSIRSHLLSGMLSIYDEAFSVCEENKEPDLTMLTFQELLGEVPKWNSVMISDETNRIIEESSCDYLEDLLTAVFVCHTKILTTVRVTNKDRKINLKIPSVENFLHQVYIEMAREFWKHPYLLNPMEVSKLEYQQNLRKAEIIIHDCLESTVRKLLPVKDILKEYLNEDNPDDTDTENDSSEEDGSGPRNSSRSRKASPADDDDDETTANDKKRLSKGLSKSIKSNAASTAADKEDVHSTSYKDTLRKELSELKANAKTDGVTFENEPSSPVSKPSGLTNLLTSTTSLSPTTVPSPPGSPTKPAFDKMVDQLEKGLSSMTGGGESCGGGSGGNTLGGESDVKTVNIGKASSSSNGNTPSTSSNTTTPTLSTSPLPSPSASSTTSLSSLLSAGGGSSSNTDPDTTGTTKPISIGSTGSSTPPILDLSNAIPPSPPAAPSSLLGGASSPTPHPPSSPSGTTPLDLNSLLGSGNNGNSLSSDMPVVNVDFGRSSLPSSSSDTSTNKFTFF